MSNAIKFSDDERISGIKTLNQGVKTGTLGSRAGKTLSQWVHHWLVDNKY